MKRAIYVLLALLAFLPSAQAQEFRFEDAARLFDYDAKQPLDIQERSVLERDGVRIIDLTYASPKGGRVTAYLVVPPGKGPFAGIVFGHWGPGTRTEFLPEAELYAQAGVESILVDYPWVRPAPWYRGVPNPTKPEQDRDTYIQAVVDLRRAIDLLASRADVDPKRIAYVGHSYGAQWGAILAAVDRRIKTAVLVGGTPDLAAIWLDNDDPALEQFRAGFSKEQLKKYVEVNSVLDAIRYVPHARPVPLLFQFARFERFFSQAAMDRYYRAASEPKQVKWYDTGHDLNDIQTLLDRAAWLHEQIGMKPVSAIVEQRLKPRSE